MPPAPVGPPQLPPARDLPRLRRFAVVGVSLFVGVLGLVTGVEAVAGRPLSDLLRGQSASGTTLFGASTGSEGTGTAPRGTQTVTVTQSVVVTTPTVTKTASPVTTTATPTVTQTGSPAPSSSAPSESPSPSTSP
jgi:cytoskeletal protein RodZ